MEVGQLNTSIRKTLTQNNCITAYSQNITYPDLIFVLSRFCQRKAKLVQMARGYFHRAFPIHGFKKTLNDMANVVIMQHFLQLTGVVPGRYEFKLRVTDGQGVSDEDTASVIVKADPSEKNLVELTLNVEGSALRLGQEKSLLARLKLLLHDQTINVR